MLQRGYYNRSYKVRWLRWLIEPSLIRKTSSASQGVAYRFVPITAVVVLEGARKLVAERP